MKVQKISSNVSPLAGISFVNNSFNETVICQLINNELGTRVKTVGFSYSDIIRNQFNIFYSGGDCAEDIQTHLGKHLKSIPGNHVPSADTILRGIKELSTQNTSFTSNQGKTYDFNINTKLNLLNIKSLLLTGQLKKDTWYDFDYDNQIDMFTGDTYIYRSILTNYWQNTEREVIEYYNQRGSSKKLFDPAFAGMILVGRIFHVRS